MKSFTVTITKSNGYYFIYTIIDGERRHFTYRKREKALAVLDQLEKEGEIK